MGSSPSKSSDARRPDKKRGAKPDDVLLAPVFAVPNSTIGTNLGLLPPSVHDRLAAQRTHGPSALDFLHQTDPSVRLLQDFMQPGVWVSAAAAASTQVRASVVQALSGSITRLTVQRSVGDLYAAPDDNSVVQILAGTDSLPSIRARLGNDAVSLSAQADVQGRGWFGGTFARTVSFATNSSEPTQQEYYLNDPFQNDENGSNIDLNVELTEAQYGPSP